MKCRIVVSATFDAAHHLPQYPGKCAHVHGHTWTVRVAFGYNKPLDGLGMSVDFSTIKGVLRSWTNRLDHTYLNNKFKQPTAEVLAANAYRSLKGYRPNGSILEWIEIEETPGCVVRVLEVD